MEGIARWLVNDAPHDSVKGLFAAFCEEVVRSGVPVWRATLGLEVIHPEVSGWQHVWTPESLSVEAADRATAPTSDTPI
jgi:adenylate cyclase